MEFWGIFVRLANYACCWLILYIVRLGWLNHGTKCHLTTMRQRLPAHTLLLIELFSVSNLCLTVRRKALCHSLFYLGKRRGFPVWHRYLLVLAPLVMQPSDEALYLIEIAVPRRYRAFFMVYNQFFLGNQECKDLFFSSDHRDVVVGPRKWPNAKTALSEFSWWRSEVPLAFNSYNSLTIATFVALVARPSLRLPSAAFRASEQSSIIQLERGRTRERSGPVGPRRDIAPKKSSYYSDSICDLKELCNQRCGFGGIRFLHVKGFDS